MSTVNARASTNMMTSNLNNALTLTNNNRNTPEQEVETTETELPFGNDDEEPPTSNQAGNVFNRRNGMMMMLFVFGAGAVIGFSDGNGNAKANNKNNAVSNLPFTAPPKPSKKPKSSKLPKGSPPLSSKSMKLKSDEPSFQPSALPTVSAQPSTKPSVRPSVQPSMPPSMTPSVQPSFQPSMTPSACTDLTPQARAAKFRQMAIQIAGTPDATLNNENSPQAQALDWISNKDQITPPLCSSDEEALQRYIMAAFYFATGGGSWRECNAPADSSPAAIAAANQNCNIEATSDAWLTPNPICDWAGLACHNDDERNGTLDQIEFEDNNLSGSLIDEIGLLKNLRFLILEGGTIEGEIPESIGNLPLLILDLNFNVLIGPIPASLYNIKSLQQLDLNDNQMTGSLSSDVKHWQEMIFLQLDYNYFTGTIPSELGQLQNLRVATFQSNGFTGSIPLSVSNLSLDVLAADCAGQSPKVVCDSCTACY